MNFGEYKLEIGFSGISLRSKTVTGGREGVY